MRLYRKDFKDIKLLSFKRNRIIVSALYFTPILMGLILHLPVIGMTIFTCYLPIMIAMLITLDSCCLKYLAEKYLAELNLTNGEGI